TLPFRACGREALTRFAGSAECAEVAALTESPAPCSSPSARPTTQTPMLFSLGPFSRRFLSGAVAVATLAFAATGPARAQAVGASGGAAVARYADALGTANARLPRAVRRDLAERVLLLS